MATEPDIEDASDSNEQGASGNEDKFQHVTSAKHDKDDQELTASVDAMDLSGTLTVKDRLLDRVAKSNGFFKSQQRGDPDLTYREKLEIGTDMLDKKPILFLERFGKFLKLRDLAYFEPKKDDYAINFHIGEITKYLDNNASKTKIKNRRFEAMKKLLEQGEYFGDEEMKSRDPLMYEQMIGQYLTDDEIQQQSGAGDGSLSALLFQHIQALHNNELYQKQVDKQESQMEEEDTDEEEEQEVKCDEEEAAEGDDPSMEEKQILREEFVHTMQERFLAGQDMDFNYKDVDSNQQYDPVDILDRDEEEKYFEEEDPECCMSQDSGSMGDPCRTAEDLVVEDYEQFDPNSCEKISETQSMDNT